jgi:diguanylate cyclase (GGDEF)-like protein
MATPQPISNGPPPQLPFFDITALEAFTTDQSAADDDQSTADADQTAQDADQSAAERDELAAENDQAASDRDQTAADRDQAADPAPTRAETQSYELSRLDREAATNVRFQSHLVRGETAIDRSMTAAERDAMAAARDDSARRRDARAQAIEESITASDAPTAESLQLLRAQAAADRERAAADRQRAAADRALAAAERERLEAGLRTAHLDDLTGAYRRGVGMLAISNEVERARRSGGPFVVAFVDVDDMKGLNDRAGHAAGDLVLQALVRIMRSHLRPFDPVIRYGGDEFLCGMGGLDVEDSERRFREIGDTLEREVGVGVSFGLAMLQPGETPDQVTARADEALLEAKASRAQPAHA